MDEAYILRRYYPLVKINHGTMLGDGVIGLFVWGGDNILNISLGCAGLWDHRGGTNWLPEQNFNEIRTALYSGNDARLKEIFKVSHKEGDPARQTLIPVGRLSLQLSDGCRLLYNELDMKEGILNAVYSRENECRSCIIEIHPGKNGYRVQCDDIKAWSIIPSFEMVPELAETGFAKPDIVNDDGVKAFLQKMPDKADGTFGIVAAECVGGMSCTFARGIDMDGLLALKNENAGPDKSDFWKNFWKEVPSVHFEDEFLQKFYAEALFKFESMTSPSGIPAGLQGPWLEDNAMPPWSGDYHFNINVQMCYGPALRSGRWANLRRLFDMVWSWKDKLRNNARLFAGIDNGYMLPHAVDDTGRALGGFWTGTLDHGCTAWVAQMMYDYADYTGDVDFLRNIAFDFMQGAFNVYYAMMEEADGRLSMPVTISPEYRGSDTNAWGADASFQLAACHRLVRNLIAAAEVLGEKPDEKWLLVSEKLPQACLAPFVKDWGENMPIKVEGEQEIALWDGVCLNGSHRHHSHLAGICPFNTLDPESSEWAAIVRNSIARWVGKGMSGWTGWCVPWASSIQVRLDNPQAANTLLKLWHASFVNPGGCSTHDAVYHGVFQFCGRPDIIQLDGTMGALSAIQDMLLHDRCGVLHLFAGVVCGASFENMPAPGGFVVSASNIPAAGDAGNARVRAMRSGDLRLRLHIPCGRIVCRYDGREMVFAGDDVIELHLEAGSEAVFSAI